MSTSRRFREAKKHQNHTAQAPSPRAENLERRLCRASLELLSNAMGLTCAARMLTVNHYVTPRQVQPLVRRRRAYYIA
jgi:hypothetical protein